VVGVEHQVVTSHVLVNALPPIVAVVNCNADALIGINLDVMQNWTVHKYVLDSWLLATSSLSTFFSQPMWKPHSWHSSGSWIMMVLMGWCRALDGHHHMRK